MEATESQTLSVITISLESVIKGLPEQLKSFIAKIPAADDQLEFPPARIVPQLTKGSVKVTFGEIIHAAPSGMFQGVAGKEGDEVSLPLGEILPQIGPNAMQRQSSTQAPSLEPQAFFTPAAVASPPPAPVQPPPTQAAPPAPTANLFAPATPPTSSQSATPAAVHAPADGNAALSLAPILETLPDELKALISTPPDATASIELPVAKLMPQLAKGKITISFSELVAGAPAGTFSGTGGKDSTVVQLPLGEVLSKVGPGAFKRDAPVKKLEGLEQDFFGGSKPAPAPAATPEITPAPSIPTSPPAPEPSEAAAPLFSPSLPDATAPAPAALFQPTAPAAPEPPASVEPEPIPDPEPSAPAAAESEGEDVKEIAIPIGKIIDRWPEGLKAEVSKLPPDSIVVFPAEELGNCLKSGKVSFTWSRVRNWLHPKSQFGANAWEGSTLDIPLKALVAPFMAAMRGKPITPLPSGRTRATSGSAAAAAAGISLSAKPIEKAPAPTYTPPTFSPSAGFSAGGPSAAAQVSLGALLGLPSKEHWTPVEIVQRVAGLPAVSGALLSLSEGQVAASELPSSVQPDVMAFRIPKMYAAAADQVKEMSLEPMAHLAFTSAGTPWVIFRLGNIFFTVCGRPGEHLPVSRLQSIAVEVGRQPR